MDGNNLRITSPYMYVSKIQYYQLLFNNWGKDARSAIKKRSPYAPKLDYLHTLHYLGYYLNVNNTVQKFVE